MKIQRILTALVVGILAGLACIAFINWSFDIMEWHSAQRAAVLIIAFVVVGFMEGTRE